ncbi:MAG: AAA family ATPase [Deltaproteobacteria bacterium]|nr:AAA family ATPase [Deltaproteobacteria bacterium]
MKNSKNGSQSQGKIGHKQRFVLFQLTKVDWSEKINQGSLKKGEANQIVGLARKYKAGKVVASHVEKYIQGWFPDWTVQKMDSESPAPDNSDEIKKLQNELRAKDKQVRGLQDIVMELKRKVSELKKRPKPQLPKPKKSDYIKPKIWDEVVSLIKAKINVLISGPAGCGKSRMVSEVAKALNQNCFCVSFSGGVRYAQAFGTTQINGGKSHWEPSQLLKAVQKPGIVLLDEIFAADPEVLLGLNSLLEPDSRSILTPIGEIKVHKNCHFVACANTVGRSKDRQYKGAQRVDDSMLDRFTTMKMGYDPKVEETILNNMGVENGDGEINYLTESITALRINIATHNVPFDPSTRRLINAGKAILAGLNKERAFEVAFLNSLSKIERGKVRC